MKRRGAVLPTTAVVKARGVEKPFPAAYLGNTVLPSEETPVAITTAGTSKRRAKPADPAAVERWQEFDQKMTDRVTCVSGNQIELFEWQRVAEAVLFRRFTFDDPDREERVAVCAEQSDGKTLLGLHVACSIRGMRPIVILAMRHLIAQIKRELLKFGRVAIELDLSTTPQQAMPIASDPEHPEILDLPVIFICTFHKYEHRPVSPIWSLVVVDELDDVNDPRNRMLAEDIRTRRFLMLSMNTPPVFCMGRLRKTLREILQQDVIFGGGAPKPSVREIPHYLTDPDPGSIPTTLEAANAASAQWIGYRMQVLERILSEMKPGRRALVVIPSPLIPHMKNIVFAQFDDGCLRAAHLFPCHAPSELPDGVIILDASGAVQTDNPVSGCRSTPVRTRPTALHRIITNAISAQYQEQAIEDFLHGTGRFLCADQSIIGPGRNLQTWISVIVFFAPEFRLDRRSNIIWRCRRPNACAEEIEVHTIIGPGFERTEPMYYCYAPTELLRRIQLTHDAELHGPNGN